jgi:hypothetical protein
MKFKKVPPGEGVIWVRLAFQAFFRQPFGFAGLFAACALVYLVLFSIPVVGEALFSLLAPLCLLLFMIATRRGANGERPLPGAITELVAGPRQRLREMFKLGLVYLVVALCGTLAIAAAEGDAVTAFYEAMSAAQPAPEVVFARLTDPRLLFGFLLRLGFGGLLSVMFWHAPALVWWGAQGWAKALFFSVVAIWRNKGAFTVYGLVWIGLGFAVTLVLAVFVSLFGGQRFVAAALFLFFLTVLYASLWFTFAGCFEVEAEPEPAAA